MCSARAVGEFGAVYVVSGRIAGRGQTIPLRVEQLFQQYQTPADFALASILTLVAIASLVSRRFLEYSQKISASDKEISGEKA